MKNSFLIFESIDIPELNSRVTNFSTLNLINKIDEIIVSDLRKFNVHNDMFLEAISYNIHKVPDYWDIIMVMNGITSMNQLPVNYDIVLKRTQKKYDKLHKEIANISSKPFSGEFLRQEYLRLLNEEEEKNEKYRVINYVVGSVFSDVLTEITKNKNKKNINESLLV